MKLGGYIIDWHACDLFPKSWIDLVAVLRVDNGLLYDRLKERLVRPGIQKDNYECERDNANIDSRDRNYPEAKLQENLDAEIMQVLLEEARESYDEDIVIELQSNTPVDTESNVERIEKWIEEWRKNNAAGTQ